MSDLYPSSPANEPNIVEDPTSVTLPYSCVMVPHGALTWDARSAVGGAHIERRSSERGRPVA